MTKIFHKLKIHRSVFLLLGAVLAMAIVFFVVGSSSSIGGVQKATWIRIDPQDIELQLGLVGRIESASRQVMAAPFEGVIEKISFVEGGVVEEGDLLITLGTTQMDVQMRQALSELLRTRQAMRSIQDWVNGDEVARSRRNVATTELNLHDTSAKLKESRQLYERGIVARMEVDSLEQQIKLQSGDLVSAESELRSVMARGTGEGRKIAEMDLANAQARYDDLSAQRNKRELRASVKGIALRPPKNDGVGQALPIQVGQKVAGGAALVEVASVAHVHALARVEESDLHVLHEGMDVRISGDGFSGLTMTGRLLSIGAQAIPSGTVGSSGTYDVIVDIAPLSPEQQKLVRLGMSARLNIVTYTRKNSFVVPASAIRKDIQGNTLVSYRPSLQSPSKDIQVTVGKVTPLGVEVIGLSPGYVLSE